MSWRLQAAAGWAAAATVVPAFVGCARFESKPVSPSVSLAAFESRGLGDAGLRQFVEANLNHPVTTWPPPVWNLTNLVLAALYYHPDLDVARARWGASNAAMGTAGQRPNPTLGVTPGFNSTTPAGSISPWILDFKLDLPIETAGKRGHRIAQARELSEAARFNFAAVAWQVRSRVRRSLLDLHAAQENQALLEELAAVQSSNVSLLNQQLAAGAISSFEVAQARIALDGTRLALQDALKQSAESRVQLADALGLPVRALDGVRLSFEEFRPPPRRLPEPDARRQALLNRADLLGALAEYAASESALRLEIAKQYPDVNLSPGYQLDQTDNKWSLGLSVTLPLINQNQGPIAEAEARRLECAARFNALQARVIGEIDRAVAGLQAALDKAAVADALFAEREKVLRSARALFAAGGISRPELVSTQLEVGTAELARLDAWMKAQHAVGQLEDALQRPVERE